MYAILGALNIYEKQQRVCAHKHTPVAREELKRLRELAPRLRELGIRKIICSDLDGQSAEALGRRLNVPVEEWQSLRRRNWGKLHGTSRADAQRILGDIVEYTVPLKGGDSYASFNKRVEASAERLRAAGSDVLVVADPEVLQKLIGAAGASRYRIYQIEVTLGQSDKAEAVQSSAASV